MGEQRLQPPGSDPLVAAGNEPADPATSGSGRGIRFVGPTPADPRLLVAATVMSIHVMGQLVLHFGVSVPQIAVAVVSCGLAEVAIGLVRSRVVAWPASGLLTGSGVGLILRDVGTSPGDHWSTQAWWLFALVAVGSLLTKYLIRWRGRQVFNPSNLGLVVAFLALGSDQVEPLDLWWSPLTLSMVTAYWVILAGGLLAAERTGLLELAAAFWVTFVAGAGALASSGHCVTTGWSVAPVCDDRFFLLIATSPEVLIFSLLMVTDPRTVPTGRIARRVFGAAVATLATILMAPARTELGLKVSLLAALTLVCASRPVVGAVNQRFGLTRSLTRLRLSPRVVVGLSYGAVMIVAIGAAGAGARTADAGLATASVPDSRQIIPTIDPARLPSTVTVDDEVRTAFGSTLDPQVVAVELLRALDVEAVALEQGDSHMLTAVDHGRRLEAMRHLQATARTTPTPTPTGYRFESIHLHLVQPRGQGGLRLAATASGTVSDVQPFGSGPPSTAVSRPFEVTFVLRAGLDGRWFVVDAADSE